MKMGSGIRALEGSLLLVERLATVEGAGLRIRDRHVGLGTIVMGNGLSSVAHGRALGVGRVLRWNRGS
jgi:hypothetical protein